MNNLTSTEKNLNNETEHFFENVEFFGEVRLTISEESEIIKCDYYSDEHDMWLDTSDNQLAEELKEIVKDNISKEVKTTENTTTETTTVFILSDERLGDSCIYSSYDSMIESVRSTMKDLQPPTEMTDEEMLNETEELIGTLDYKEYEESEVDASDYTYDCR